MTGDAFVDPPATICLLLLIVVAATVWIRPRSTNQWVKEIKIMIRHSPWSAPRDWIDSPVATSTTWTLPLSLPQIANFVPSANTHCLIKCRVDTRLKEMDGVLAGNWYTSNVPVVRLSTSNRVSSCERVAFPLNKESIQDDIEYDRKGNLHSAS